MTQQSWVKIENHYLEARDYMPDFSDMHVAMAEFCNWIGESSMSASLFGRTSHHTLLVSQIKFQGAVHPTAQLLRINPDFKTETIEFRLLDTHLEDRQWVRSELPSSKALIERLIGFTKQLGWSNSL